MRLLLIAIAGAATGVLCLAATRMPRSPFPIRSILGASIMEEAARIVISRPGTSAGRLRAAITAIVTAIRFMVMRAIARTDPSERKGAAPETAGSRKTGRASYQVGTQWPLPQHRNVFYAEGGSSLHQRRLDRIPSLNTPEEKERNAQVKITGTDERLER